MPTGGGVPHKGPSTRRNERRPITRPPGCAIAAATIVIENAMTAYQQRKIQISLAGERRIVS
jgi:hypothetical protein